MTKENAKRLYDHYVEVEREDLAANMLQKYPEFADKENKESNKKSKD